MRINVGLPGPFSVGGNLPKGAGPLLALLVLIVILCCCGGAITQNFLEQINRGAFQCTSCK